MNKKELLEIVYKAIKKKENDIFRAYRDGYPYELEIEYKHEVITIKVNKENYQQVIKGREEWDESFEKVGE